jgi:hypothetical protein
MEAKSSFLEKLSPETRLSIYSHVFGPSLAIKPSSSDTALGMKKHPLEDTVYLQETGTTLNPSILATSKFIYNEALPVLYKDRIIRGTTRDFQQLFENSDFTEHARHIEIADCISTYQDADFHAILCRLQSLPRVRSLAILSDCLYSFCRDDRSRLYTVPRFCEEANLGEATCVDIGRYQLHDKFAKCQFVHRRLVQLWPGVKSTPDDYDPFHDFECMRTKWPPRGNSQDFARWYLQTSLRCWIDMAEEVRRVGLAHSLESHDASVECPHMPDEAQLEIFDEFLNSTCPFDFNSLDMNTDSNIARVFKDCPCPISQLAPEHGHEVLSKVTEILSLETTIYYSEYDNNGRPQKRWREAHWAETDGCMPTIDFMLMHQDIARAGLPDAHYFQNPVRPEELEVIDRVDLWIAQHAVTFGVFMPCTARREIHLLGDLEKKQLANLAFAMTNYSFDRDRPDDHNYVPDLHVWSADLLRRYVLASGQATPAEVAMMQNVGSDDLRAIVRAVLDLLVAEENVEFLRLAPLMRTFAPEGFDDDLYEPFAWLYGPLLMDCCRWYLNTSNLGLDWEPYLTDRFAGRPSVLHSYENRRT